MTPEQEAELRRLGPDMFSHIRSFECDAGWFELLKKLVVIIQAEIDRLPEAERAQVYARQVKEKLGGLRFYMSEKGKKNAAIRAAIERAEELSFKTCEVCGNSGECSTVRNWVATRCKEHPQGAA